ncbi:MAG: GAF domain-containing protein [Nitrospirae bacterium]|nr:GAF domain-containing protein [Nitrospirota bacterium]
MKLLDRTNLLARHQARLAEIHFALDRISDSVLDLAGRLNAVTQVIRLQLRCDVCSIYLLDSDGGGVTLRASYGLAASMVGRARLRLGEGVTGWVAENLEAVALADAADDPRFKYLPGTGEERFRSLLSVPIVADQSFVGVINVQHAEVHPFTNHETLLVAGIGYKVGAMIRAASLERSLRQQQLGIDLLLAAGGTVAGGQPLARMLPTLVTKSRHALGASGAVLRVFDPQTETLRVNHVDGTGADVAGFGPLRLGEGIAGRAAAARRTVRANDYGRFAGQLMAPGIVSSSLLCVPLVAEDTLVGTLTAFDKVSELDDRGFTLEDEQLLKGAADLMAVALLRGSTP